MEETDVILKSKGWKINQNRRVDIVTVEFLEAGLGSSSCLIAIDDIKFISKEWSTTR